MAGVMVRRARAVARSIDRQNPVEMALGSALLVAARLVDDASTSLDANRSLFRFQRILEQLVKAAAADAPVMGVSDDGGRSDESGEQVRSVVDRVQDELARRRGAGGADVGHAPVA